jgi:hypothetical protein
MSLLDIAVDTLSGAEHMVRGLRETDPLIVLKRRIGVVMDVPWYFVIVCMGDVAFKAKDDGKTLKELGVCDRATVVMMSPWQENDAWMQLLPRTAYEYSRSAFITQGGPNGCPRFQVSVFQEGSDEGTVSVDMNGSRVAEFKAESLFVGLDSSDTSLLSVGNSVLLKLCEAPVGLHRYAFVGEQIYTFQTSEPVLKYFSQIGNNHMSYPVAIGPTLVFFFLDCKCMQRTDLEEPSNHVDWEGFYSFFYEAGSSLKFPMQDVVHLAPC